MRSASIVMLVGMLLTDPILCRADAAANSCALTNRSRHDACPSHSCPCHSGSDSVHGCLCQGAISEAQAKAPSVHDGVEMAPAIASDLLLSLGLSRPGPLQQYDQTRPHTTGRVVRIERQSFQV